MPDLGLALSESLHALAAALPRFDHRFAAADVPGNGVYLFFERGETVTVGGREIPRIVRVGSHRGDGRLAKRLRLHFAGSRRRSVFRRHVGGALLTRETPSEPRIGTWIGQKGKPMPDVERVVDQEFRERFSFVCIPVDDPAERLDLERGLIAQLAQRSLGPPSAGWLGHHAVHPAVRASGLWNTQHVEGEPLTFSEFARLVELAGATTAGSVQAGRPRIGGTPSLA